MAKFFFFEKIVGLFYSEIFTAPRETYDKTTQLGITFASGYSAGVVCAIVSHPADSLVSLQGKASNKGKSLGVIASETGFGNLLTKGLGTRVIMIGQFTYSVVLVGLVLICYVFRYPHWLPVVDLRHIQEQHGSRHVRWQVNVAWCGLRIYSLDLIVVVACVHWTNIIDLFSSRTFCVLIGTLSQAGTPGTR
jgi:hypothetical protein